MAVNTQRLGYLEPIGCEVWKDFQVDDLTSE